LHSQLRKGHTTKKDIPMFLIGIASPQKVSFTYNPEAPFGLELGAERLMAERERRGYFLKSELS